MKRYLLFIAFSIICNSAISQDDLIELVPIKIGSLYGYGIMNKKPKMAIKPMFDFALPFFHGFAIVYKGDKEYLIDRTGKIVLEQIGKRRMGWKGNFFLNGSNFKRPKFEDLVLQEDNLRFIRFFNLLKEKSSQRGYRKIRVAGKNRLIVQTHKGEQGVIDFDENIVIPFRKGVIVEYIPYEKPEGFGDYNFYEKNRKACKFYNHEGILIGKKDEDCSINTVGINRKPWEIPALVRQKSEGTKAEINRWSDEFGNQHWTVGTFAANRYIYSKGGELLCDECQKLLPCKEYFVKYIKTGFIGGLRQNLIDRKGNFIFKKNYDFIKVIDGNTTACPNIFIKIYRIVEDKKMIGYKHQLMNLKERNLSQPFEKIKVISSNLLIGRTEDGDNHIMRNNGKLIVKYSDLKKKFPFLNEVFVKYWNGVIVISNKERLSYTHNKDSIIYMSLDGKILN